MLVVAASIGTKKRRDAFYRGGKDVMGQVLPAVNIGTASWRADSDTGLQIADYCGWAIYRKWEIADTRSHRLIAPKISSEFDLFSRGSQHHY